MSPQVMTILALILEALPYAIRGVESAVRMVEAGSKLFRDVIDANRDPTDEEMAAVTALRQADYSDFYEDDEAAPQT